MGAALKLEKSTKDETRRDEIRQQVEARYSLGGGFSPVEISILGVDGGAVVLPIIVSPEDVDSLLADLADFGRRWATRYIESVEVVRLFGGGKR